MSTSRSGPSSRMRVGAGVVTVTPRGIPSSTGSRVPAPIRSADTRFQARFQSSSSLKSAARGESVPGGPNIPSGPLTVIVFFTVAAYDVALREDLGSP
ncbi:hypothetical protein ACCO45_004111 [Purpureocillium lilacinum]|uniref:Uncharacterized protein n=1 Tax=Purpureocillium lilacinum TaxID=33203 RepID=A0ACC4E4Z0_PURLI